jgi:hypothetical protein
MATVGVVEPALFWEGKMDTSRKTEITTIVEGAAAEVESAGTQPCISASEERSGFIRE